MQPPKRALNFLRWFCREAYLDEIEGDLIELFEKNQTNSSKKAKLTFWWQVILHFRPAYIKSINLAHLLIFPDMLQINFKIAWRQIIKNKLNAIINIVGLSVGLACCIVILLYVNFESSFDQFHAEHEKVYRIASATQEEGIALNSAMNHSPMADVLTSFLPEADQVVRMFPYPIYARTGDLDKSKEDKFCFAEEGFFNTFSFPSLEQPIKDALKAPFSVVLTEEKALKYFNSTDVLGKTIKIENDRKEFDFTVTGVLANLPENTHFDFEMLGSFSTLDEIMPSYNNWHYPPMYIYMKTKTGINEQLLEDKIAKIASEHQPDYVLEENREYDAQALTAIHLHSRKQGEWKPTMSYQYIKLFILIAFFILTIACLNYINLATTQSFKRAKEVGIRKTMGSKYNQLVWQFLAEAFLISLIAGGASLLIAHLSITNFVNDLTDRNLSLSTLLEANNWMFFIGAILIVSIVSGLYPAFRLSSLKPAITVKGTTDQNPRKIFSLRRGLVAFQFIISAFLIISTLLVYKQFQFIQTSNLGFNKEAIITLNMVDKYSSTNYQVLKEQLEKHPQIASTTISSSVPGKSNFYGFEVFPKEGIQTEKGISINSLGMDEDFIDTYGIKIVEGRGFSADITTDENEAFLVNREAVEAFGWEGSPLGQELTFQYYTRGAVQKKGQVIGVVDFHFQSLHQSKEPIILYINKHPFYTDYLSVKANTKDLKEVMDILNTTWKAFHPDKPMDYFFLDDEISAMYKAEMMFTRIFIIFAVLSIFIACLGIFGLSAYSVLQRSKEISIRKVFGASNLQVFQILSKEYFFIILLANLLVIPMIIFFGNKWLENFAYHTNISSDIFIVSCILCLLVGFITISYQTMKAILLNPSKKLRSE